MSKLFKRDGIWYAWVRDRNGKTVKRTTGCTTREAAERTVPRLELEAADPAYAAANRTTTQEVLDDYYRSRERLGRAEGTLHHVRIKAGALLGLLPPVVAEITHVKLLAYVDKRLAEGARRTTAKKELRVLKAALRLARRNGKWYGDPDAVIPELEDDYEPRKRALTPWELIALVPQLSWDRAAHVVFIVATSARWSESLKFTKWDISRDSFRHYVRLHGTKTKGSDRSVPIIGAAESMLVWSINHCADLKRGCFQPWPNVRRDLAAACRRAGIEPVTPNDLRRTFGTWLRNAGAEPSVIGSAMGHVDSRMVETTYGRLTAEALGRLLEQQTAGRYTGLNSSERARPNVNGATPGAAKTLENSCAGTESNCRHGDFQSGAPEEQFEAVSPGAFACVPGLIEDVWSICGPFFARPIEVRP